MLTDREYRKPHQNQNNTTSVNIPKEIFAAMGKPRNVVIWFDGERMIVERVK